MNTKLCNSYITLSLCSALLDFMVIPQYTAIFPRERTVHIVLSVFAAYIVVLFIKNTDINNKFFRYFILFTVASKSVYTTYIFLNYFKVYYAFGTTGFLVILSAIIILAYRLEDKSMEQIYIFFIFSNVLLLIIIIVLSVNRLNVINIYSNDMNIRFSFYKMFVFFDIFTIAAITPKGKHRIKAQKKYINITATAFVFITILQGLSVKGNLMYSISPLQSLSQIFTGTTIRRFDYTITIFQSINYFASIIIYVFTIKKLTAKGGENEFE